jgi:tripartite-type tricarboxylate transporter receptor subunit TctC
MRRFGASVALLLAGSAMSFPASAQEWPARTVTVVVPLGAGSASDIMARVVAEQLGKQLGQTFVVENRPGAGGTIGAGMVAKSAPDGYTVLAYGALATAHALHTKLPYDTLNDFVAVIPFGQQPLVVVTAPGKGYKTLRDLIAAAKTKPGALNYSSAGIGSASHFAAERLRVSAGIEAQHIAFKGAAEAVTEVVAERIDFSPQLFTTTLPLLRDGKLMALAVSANKRTSVMPEVPTTIEAGLAADSVYPFYSGLFLPAKTPRDIVEKLQREAAKALQAPAVQARFTTLGVEPMAMTLDEFAKFVRDDVDAAVTLVKAAKIPTQ